MRMLDLFCGRFGWGRSFAERGCEVVGIDLVEPPEIPVGCSFIQANILELHLSNSRKFLIGIDNPAVADRFDFICASSPCEQFSVHGMKHFHPDPPYPALGIKLFNHTRALCEASGASYVMENVRAAQQFVGRAVNHCGPFFLWGNGIPPLMPQGIKKAQGLKAKYSPTPEMVRRGLKTEMFHIRSSMPHSERAGLMAVIPPELSSCVADYAERLLEVPA